MGKKKQAKQRVSGAKAKINSSAELEHKQLFSILDSIDEAVYIVDPNNYEILYINKNLRKLFGDTTGKKCYEAFQGLEFPCAFCTNKYIFGKNLGKSYIWDFQNRFNHRWYHCIDKAIRWPDGRMVRCEIAIDITERKTIEEDLKNSKARYEAIIEDQTEFIDRTLPDGTIIFANKALCNYVKLSHKKLIGKNIYSFIAPEHAYIMKKKFKATTKKNPSFTIEHKAILPNGEERWHLWTNHAIFDRKGNKIEFQSTGRDITVYKKMEQELRQEKEIAQKYLNIAGVIIIVIDKNQKIRLINKRGCDLLGYKNKELIGKNWFNNFVPYNIRKETKGVFSKLISGEVKPAEYYENPIIDRYGNERIIAWHNTIIKDDKGAIIGTISSGEDITERKIIEKELKLTKFSIDRAAVSAFWMGPDAKFRYVNDAACKRLGYTRSELLSMSVHDIDPKFPKEVWPKHWKEIKKKGSFSFESIHRKKQGELFPVEITVNYFEFNGQEYNFAFATDISERKKSELALQESKRLCERGLYNLRDAVFIIDTNMETIMDSNPAASRIFGYDRGELVGQKIMSLYARKKDFNRFRDYLCSATEKEGFLANFYIDMKRKDGSKFLSKHDVLPLEDEIGRRECWVCMVSDVTIHKK